MTHAPVLFSDGYLDVVAQRGLPFGHRLCGLLESGRLYGESGVITFVRRFLRSAGMLFNIAMHARPVTKLRGGSCSNWYGLLGELEYLERCIYEQGVAAFIPATLDDVDCVVDGMPVEVKTRSDPFGGVYSALSYIGHILTTANRRVKRCGPTTPTMTAQGMLEVQFTGSQWRHAGVTIVRETMNTLVEKIVQSMKRCLSGLRKVGLYFEGHQYVECQRVGAAELHIRETPLR